MPRYLLGVNFEGGVVETPMEEWKPEEITAHLDYYKALGKELVASGERVQSEVLAGPDLAKIVTSDGLTAPVITDGPFQEFKEWLAGYQIVDVESEARAIEIAAKLSAVPGPGGRATQQPIQVRQVMDEAPSDVAEMEGYLQQSGWLALNVPSGVEDLLRELAPQVLGALARRYGDFDAAEDAVQEALLAAAVHWPRDGVPEKPRGWLLQTAERRLIDQRRSERSRRDRESRACAAGGAAAGGLRPGRHADRAVHVLPSGADAGLGDRADATGGRRTDHGRDREARSWWTRRRWPSASPGRSSASRPPVCRSGCRHPRSARPGCASVLHVLYLIFNEGYASSSGRELQRTELSDEAIRLTRMVQRLLPDDGEVTGLLALMLLLDARRPARTDAAGRAGPARRAGSSALGPGARRRGDRPPQPRGGHGRGRRVPAPGGHRGRPRPGCRGPRTRTGRRSSPSTGCSSR